MNIVVIEDAAAIAKTLKKYIEEYDPSYKVVKILKSVESSIEYLSIHKMPDLIFSDVELNDGVCFEIFESIDIKCPIIFTTSYSEYWQKAFAVNSINYLLKPITKKQIFDCINQYENTKGYYNDEEHNLEVRNLLNSLIREKKAQYKERFLFKKGNKYSIVNVNDIVYITSSEKLTFIIDDKDNQFLTYESLSNFEPQLRPTLFFRISRKFIINMNFIKNVKPYFKGKLKVVIGNNNKELIVSQSRAPEFKKWLNF